jgi:hypothetical protein
VHRKAITRFIISSSPNITRMIKSRMGWVGSTHGRCMQIVGINARRERLEEICLHDRIILKWTYLSRGTSGGLF